MAKRGDLPRICQDVMNESLARIYSNSTKPFLSMSHALNCFPRCSRLTWFPVYLMNFRNPLFVSLSFLSLSHASKIMRMYGPISCYCLTVAITLRN